MKRIFTLLLVLCLVLSVNAQKKKVAYFGLDKNASMDAGATKAQNDPVLTMLKADANLEVTAIFVLNQDTTAIDFSGYDVIVIQESFSGSSNIFKPTTGALGIAKLNKPTLLNKTYIFKAGRAFATGALGTGAETMGTGATNQFLYLKVPTASQSLDLFKGLTYVGDSVKLFNAMAEDGGVCPPSNANWKAMNYATGVVLSNTTTLLAQPATVKTADQSILTVCINDIPSGTTIGSETTAARMITFGLNYGATCATNGTNITAAGLTLWKNAVYSLAGLTIPTSATGVTVTGAGSATTITAKGGTLQMSAAVTPDNATDKTVTWSVDDATIATISATGLLTAVKNGTVKVIAAANGGTNIKDTLDITISGQNVGMKQAGSKSLVVYTNSACDELVIENAQAGNYKIMNISGKVVSSGTINTTVKRVDISNLKHGTYMVRTANGKVSKFVIR